MPQYGHDYDMLKNNRTEALLKEFDEWFAQCEEDEETDSGDALGFLVALAERAQWQHCVELLMESNPNDPEFDIFSAYAAVDSMLVDDDLKTVHERLLADHPIKAPKPTNHQYLATLRDGQQVMVQCTDPNPSIRHRNSYGAVWGLPFDRSNQPHKIGTVFEGEY